MKAMILAAGRGERMRPLTDHTPKPLLMVGGKPLVVWHIERLAQAGFQELVINHAYLGEKIEAVLGDGKSWGVSILYSAEVTALETAGGIANALPLLGEDPFLVVNADIWTDIEFTSLQLTTPHLAQLVMVKNSPHHPNGDFAFNNDKLVTQGVPKLTYSGVGVYHPNLFQSVALGSRAKLAPLLKAAMRKHLITGKQHQGAWHDIGTPERLEKLDAILQNTLSEI